jgi:hypothetical protein
MTTFRACPHCGNLDLIEVVLIAQNWRCNVHEDADGDRETRWYGQPEDDWSGGQHHHIECPACGDDFLQLVELVEPPM